jgi:hypothetical protein
MADNDFDSDATLAFFAQMGKGVDELKTKITNLNQAGDAMKKMTHETERFGQAVNRQVTGSLRGMETSFIGVVGGVSSIALGMFGVAKALDSFAVSQLRSRNFGIDTGFTSGVKNLRIQLSAAGIAADEASQGIANIGGKLQEVLALQETSPFYKALQASNPLMAENVRHLMNAGKQQEALNYLQEMYNKGGERFKAWLAATTGMSKSMWEAQANGMKGLIPAWKNNKDAALEYHKTMVNLGTIFDGVWTRMTYTMLGGINKIILGEGSIDDLNKKADKFTQDFKKYFDTNVIPTLQATLQEAKAIINFVESLASDAPEPEGTKEKYESANEWWDWLFGGKDKGGAQSNLSAQAGINDIGSNPIDLSKDANSSIRDMRDILKKWEDNQGGFGGGKVNLGGGIAGIGGGTGAGQGGWSAGGSPEAGQGGPVGLSDQAGRKIDPETMRQAEILGRAGNVLGLEKLFSQKGYRMSGPACGIVATQYVKSAGFQPPTGAAIATSWHNWGQKLDPNAINDPDHPFGSMVGTYWHRRYGGGRELLKPGQTGGHVMTIVPGSFNPKTNTVDVVDQYGYSHGKRSINDMDIRFAGKEAVEAAKARAAGGTTDRGPIDKSIATPVPPGAVSNLRINLNNVPDGVKTNTNVQGDAFNNVTLSKSNRYQFGEADAR